MPKRNSSKNINNLPAKKKGKMKIAANGNKLSGTLRRGEILTDVMQRQWKIGKPIGQGGFGEIYLASDDIRKSVGQEAQYVVKVEPHSNGPLFAEMHFYHRVGKPENIENWMKARNLNFLGMPRFVGSGSHIYKGMKYRFMVLDRFGEDLQKILESTNRTFPVKTAYTLGVKILHILEYIHSKGYIHVDIKASNLLAGLGKKREDQVYLIDFGLACKYIVKGEHKEYREDLRKAHDGTIEFTSRDAHIGAHSRRGDLEILGYNMLQWLCGRLPWENDLKYPEDVSRQKCNFMANIPSLMKECFPTRSPPEGIADYLAYVAGLKFEEEPDYERCCNILISGINACGFKYDGKLAYSSFGSSLYRPIAVQRNVKKPAVKRRAEYSPVNKRRKILEKMPSESSGITSSPCRKIRRVASATAGLQSIRISDLQNNNTVSSFDNPTPAMLLVMKKKIETMHQQQQQRQLDLMKNKLNSNKNGISDAGFDKLKLYKIILSAAKKRLTMNKDPDVKSKKVLLFSTKMKNTNVVATRIKLKPRNMYSLQL